MAEMGERRRCTALLIHPVMVLALAAWVINDHLLKESYGNWATGKLSDVCALVVFPALVAAVAEPLVGDRAMPLAVAVTAGLYSAINLVPAADALLERLMSMIVTSQLTMDTTDLAVLPAIAVPVLLWAHSSRPAAGGGAGILSRLMLLAGAATSLATGNPDTQVETVERRGEAVLSQEQPTLDIPIEVRIGGEVVSAEEHASVILSGYLLGPGDAGFRDAVHGTVLDIDGGPDVVRLVVDDPALGPAQVSWLIVVSGEPSSAVKPELKLAAPPDEIMGGAAAFELTRPVGAGGHVTELVVSAPSDTTELLLAIPDHPRRVRAASSEIVVDLTPGRPVRFPTPAGCSPEGCSFSVWLSADLLGDDVVPVTVFADPGTEIEVSEHLVRQVAQRTLDVEPRRIEGSTTVELDLDVTISDLGPVEAATHFVTVAALASAADPDQQPAWLRPDASVDTRRDPLRRLSPWASECCEARVTLTYAGDRDRFEAPVEVKAEVAVTYWAPDRTGEDGDFDAVLRPAGSSGAGEGS
jgi:hypothetical protein